jgi:glycopeptide antibiotics resistance protein
MSAKGTRKKLNRTHWLAAILLIAYSVVLIQCIVFKAIPTIHIGHRIFRFAGTHAGPSNLIPFKTIGPELSGRGNRLIAMVNLFGNILPFMPVGLLAPLVFPSIRWRKALALGVLTGLTCEGMELVFKVGIFDVDDILLNTLGVVLGYGLFLLFLIFKRQPASPRQ